MTTNNTHKIDRQVSAVQNTIIIGLDTRHFLKLAYMYWETEKTDIKKRYEFYCFRLFQKNDI